MKKSLSLSLLLAAVGCNSPSTTSAPQTTTPAQVATAAITDTTQQAITTYIKANSTTFTNYEPVSWGRPTPYTKMSEAAIKGVVAMQIFDNALVPRNKALAEYKASLARHDAPAKTAAIMARYGKANKYNDSLLLIANSFIGVKDTTRLGTQVVHAYRAKNNAGAMALDSATFVVYPTGKVEQL
ncbi:MAG: hypothetical protein ACRYG7_06075 [Janthinobacterium lividum]